MSSQRSYPTRGPGRRSCSTNGRTIGSAWGSAVRTARMVAAGPVMLRVAVSRDGVARHCPTARGEWTATTEPVHVRQVAGDQRGRARSEVRRTGERELVQADSYGGGVPLPAEPIIGFTDRPARGRCDGARGRATALDRGEAAAQQLLDVRLGDRRALEVDPSRSYRSRHPVVDRGVEGDLHRLRTSGAGGLGASGCTLLRRRGAEQSEHLSRRVRPCSAGLIHPRRGRSGPDVPGLTALHRRVLPTEEADTRPGYSRRMGTDPHDRQTQCAQQHPDPLAGADRLLVHQDGKGATSEGRRRHR